MKKIEELKNQEWVLNTADLDKITFIIEELSSYKKDSKITEEALRKIKNITREVQVIEDTISTKLIHLLKQHHMID